MLNNSISKVVGLLVAMAFIVYSAMPIVLAQTTVSLNTSSSTQTFSACAGNNLTFTTLDVRSATTTATATCSASRIAELSGGAGGWATTMTATHLGLFGSDAKKRVIAGTNAVTDVTVTGTYDGGDATTSYNYNSGNIPAGEFKVKVLSVTTGSITVAQLTLPSGSTLAPATTNYQISRNGLTWAFSGGQTFSASVEWGFLVDAFPFNGLYVATTAPSASGSATTTNITTSAGRLSGSSTNSSSRTVMTAATGYGQGEFTFDDALSWIIHANALKGGYQSTWTYTHTTS